MRTYYPKYLEPEVYNRVKSVARSYYNDLNKIKQIENDCIYATSRPDGAGGRTSYISDPTYNITQQIDKHTRVLRQRTDAVEKVLRMFSEEDQSILKQHIIEGTKITYCDTEKSEITVKRIKRKFLTTLAKELGEII